MANLLNYKLYPNIHTQTYLLIYHGLFGMLDNWHQIANKLSVYCNVVTVDLPNHGQSPHYTKMTYESMTENVIALMDSLGIEKAHHLGHSMGGKMVMKLVDLFPEKVSKLIVVDIAPRAYKPVHTPYFNALKNLDFSKFNSRKEADDALGLVEKNIGVRQFLLKNITKSHSGYSLKINLSAIEDFYPKMIDAIRFKNTIITPTLFLFGGQSNYINALDIETIKAQFKTVLFHEIENAGHWIHAEKPNETLESIIRFLD